MNPTLRRAGIRAVIAIVIIAVIVVPAPGRLSTPTRPAKW
jgi:hypothetical protein